MSRGFRWGLGAAAGVAVLAATAAWAHPKIVLARPAPSVSLFRVPVKVQVWFDEELDPRGSKLTVWNQERAQVDRGDGRVSLDDRKLLEVNLHWLAPGRYTVKWRAMADDDKGVSQGEFTFRVVAHQ